MIAVSSNPHWGSSRKRRFSGDDGTSVSRQRGPSWWSPMTVPRVRRFMAGKTGTGHRRNAARLYLKNQLQKLAQVFEKGSHIKGKGSIEYVEITGRF